MNLIANTFGQRLGHNKAHQLLWILSKDSLLWIQTNNFLEYILKKDPFFQDYVLVNFKIIKLIIKKSHINLYNNSNNHLSVKLLFKINLANKNFSKLNNLDNLEERLQFLYLEYLYKYYKHDKKYLKKIKNFKLQIKINLINSQYLIPQWIFYKLYKELFQNLTIKLILSKLTTEALFNGVEGIKIQIKGRINGVEKKTILVEEKGKMPLNNLKADIDYLSRQIHTVYGLLGVKIWIFKGFLLN